MGNNKNVGVLVLSLVLVFFGLALPTYLIFGNAEIFNPEVNFNFQILNVFVLSGIFLCLGAWFTLRFWKANNKYGDSTGYYNIGEKPSDGLFKNWTHPQLYLASIILFGSLFLLAQNLGAGSGTGLTVLPQQFSKFDSLLFSTLQTPIGENLIILGSLSVLMIGLNFLFIRYKIRTLDYKGYVYALYSLIGGLLALILHNTVYSNSDIAGYIVFSFWAIGGFITIYTGSFMPFLAMHQANNFMITYAELYSSDSRLTVTIIGLFLLGGLYYWLYRGNLWGKKPPKRRIL